MFKRKTATEKEANQRRRETHRGLFERIRAVSSIVRESVGALVLGGVVIETNDPEATRFGAGRAFVGEGWHEVLGDSDSGTSDGLGRIKQMYIPSRAKKLPELRVEFAKADWLDNMKPDESTIGYIQIEQVGGEIVLEGINRFGNMAEFYRVGSRENPNRLPEASLMAARRGVEFIHQVVGHLAQK